MLIKSQIIPVLFALSLAGFASAASAQETYKINQDFQMQGQITNYYGREKSAESYLWINAQAVCNDLAKSLNTGLILNRESEVVLSTANARSTASATYVCVPVGSGD